MRLPPFLAFGVRAIRLIVLKSPRLSRDLSAQDFGSTTNPATSSRDEREGWRSFWYLGSAWIGLPYPPRGSEFVTSVMALIDGALVFVVYTGDVRIT